MDHQTYSAQADNALPDRAPLTRLRASARAAVSGAQSQAASVSLPSPDTWAALFDDGPVPAAESHAMNEIARVRRVPPGSWVFAQADRARALVGVIDGDVALGARAEEGGFRTERHIHGPAWLDLSAGWLGDHHALDARAMSVATVIDLPRDAVQLVLARFPALAQRLLTCLAREVRALAVNTHDLMHKDAPARLAAWLSERCLPSDALPGRGVVQLPMRKRDIASQLAITPETLSRLMRNFSGQGIIAVAGYTVHVLDSAALGRLAQA